MVGDRLRALVVDDEELIRNLLQFVLEREGFDYDGATNGEDALEMYSQHKYDLIITDLSMPRFNGHNLVLKLLADKHRPMIVVHTSFKEPRLAKYMLDSGVDDIILKPANYEFLAAKLKSKVLRHEGNNSAVSKVDASKVTTLARIPTPVSASRVEEESPVSDFLPLVSPVALSVYKLTQRMEATVDEIVDEIQQDKYLTHELLRLGNQSERRGDRIECKDITQLLCRFGTRRTGELALVASVNIYSF